MRKALNHQQIATPQVSDVNRFTESQGYEPYSPATCHFHFLLFRLGPESPFFEQVATAPCTVSHDISHFPFSIFTLDLAQCLVRQSAQEGGFLIIATNLEIDQELMKEALEVSEHKTKRAVVDEALQEYVRRRKQVKIIDLFGKIQMDPEYDYKRQRNVR